MVNGASAALAISDIPWNGPIAASRIGLIDGQFVANPTIEQMYSSTLDLIYVGNEKDMLMIEGSADQLPEDKFVEALEFAHKAIQPIIKAIKELVAVAGKPKAVFPIVGASPAARAIIERIAAHKIPDAIFGKEKNVRGANMKAIKDETKAALIAELGDGKFTDVDLNVVFEDLQYKAYRKTVLERGVRSDGRDAKSLRQIGCEVGVLPMVHGSATFERGDTQGLVITTLGPTKEAQDMDGLTGGATSKSFMLHYNFPPFSVGETGRFGAPGRREIGHGALAERSLVPVLPPEDAFPYSIRVVSEIMASNGSTSMASICGGCLSLMDAGVPIIAPVAGISCGLMTDNNPDGSIAKWVTITDILGEEDHFGDMDFKLAGTTKGITGFQLDLKINGLPFEIAKAAIYQARDARIEILRKMLAVMPAPRADLSKYAPRIQTIQIDPEKIGLLIGPGGKTIRRITETTGAQIDIAEDDSGKVFIYSNNAEAMARAIQEIDGLCGGGGGPGGGGGGAPIENGKLYNGRVTGIKDFGCIRWSAHPGKEGLSPHLRARGLPRAPHRGCRQDGRHDLGEVHRDRRALRQGPPLTQGGHEGHGGPEAGRSRPGRGSPVLRSEAPRHQRRRNRVGLSPRVGPRAHCRGPRGLCRRPEGRAELDGRVQVPAQGRALRRGRARARLPHLGRRRDAE